MVNSIVIGGQYIPVLPPAARLIEGGRLTIGAFAAPIDGQKAIPIIPPTKIICGG